MHDDSVKMEEGAEELLSLPTDESQVFKKTGTRRSCNHSNLCGQYRLQRDRDYVTQYAHIYFSRLEDMRYLLERAAIRKWGKEVNLKENLLGAGLEERCCIIGTLFKKMELKPNILKEISSNHKLLPQPGRPRAKLTSKSDQLVVEDSSQRFPLSGNIPSHELVTGVVVALLGRSRKGGVFEVKDYTFAGLATQDQVEPEKKEEEEEEEEERYVLMVSGLGIGSSWSDQLSLQMLVDYITGQLGGVSDQELCSRIVRVIVAGNSVSHKLANKTTVESKEKKAKFQTRNYSADTMEAVKEVDDFLAQLASFVPVDLMPGANDPANHQLPQQPLHVCMFPQTRSTENLYSLTNPYHTVIENTVIIGCSGQNVDDIYKFSTLKNRLEILQNTLHWRHLFPTTPDTLNCYPYKDKDPFIMKTCPHVYFAGNQPSFQTSRISGYDGQSVLVVCVPNFDLTHSAVLVRLRGSESEAKELLFSSSFDHAHNPHLETVRSVQKAEEEEEEEEEDEGGGSGVAGEMTLLHLMDEDDDD